MAQNLTKYSSYSELASRPVLKALYGCFFEGFLCFYSLNRTILRRLYIDRKLPLSLSLGCAPLLGLLETQVLLHDLLKWFSRQIYVKRFFFLLVGLKSEP